MRCAPAARDARRDSPRILSAMPRVLRVPERTRECCDTSAQTYLQLLCCLLASFLSATYEAATTITDFVLHTSVAIRFFELRPREAAAGAPAAPPPAATTLVSDSRRRGDDCATMLGICHVRVGPPPGGAARPRAEKGKRGEDELPSAPPQQQRRIKRKLPTAHTAMPKMAHTTMSAVRRPRSLTFAVGAAIDAGAEARAGAEGCSASCVTGWTSGGGGAGGGGMGRGGSGGGGNGGGAETGGGGEAAATALMPYDSDGGGDAPTGGGLMLGVGTGGGCAGATTTGSGGEGDGGGSSDGGRGEGGDSGGGSNEADGIGVGVGGGGRDRGGGGGGIMLLKRELSS